jgi:hypothetical protein
MERSEQHNPREIAQHRALALCRRQQHHHRLRPTAGAHAGEDALTDLDDPHYTELYTYSELDALFELHGHLRAANQVNLSVICP